MQITDAVDVTGDGTAKTLASILGVNQARWFQVYAVSVGSTPARVGSSAVATNRGIPISANGAQFMPPSAENLKGWKYDLTAIYLLVALNDTVAVACG